MNNWRMATIALTRVEEEIVRRKRELYDLYSQRNSFIPLFRLPAEILETIFTCLARDSWPWHAATYHYRVPHWVQVSYVCRGWRAVALNCSSLWTYLFMSSPRWTEELLARSKQASLKVNVDLSRRTPRFLEQVSKHADRIEELSIDLPIRGHADFSVLSSHAPHLTYLKIAFGTELNWPSVLFNGHSPMLRTLALTCCSAPWYSLKVTGLTSLSLHRVPAQSRQTMTDFLATLRCMPNLIHLNLDNALSSATDFVSSAAFETFHKIHLPHLSRLRIDAPVSAVIALLRCLAVPLKTLVRLECASEPGLSLNDYAPLSSLLAQRSNSSDVQAPSSSTLRSLNIIFSERSVVITLSVQDRYSHVKGETWDCNVPLKVDILFEGSTMANCNSRDRVSFIGDICCSLPLTDVRSLWVSKPPSSSAFWRRTLGHLPHLSHLKLEHGSMPDLAPVLCVDHGENEGGHTGQSLGGEVAPVLGKLELCGISFRHLNPTAGSDKGCYSADAQSLFDALASRKESPGLLIMTRCFLAKDRILEVDMVGSWEDGHFTVTLENIRRTLS